MNLINWVRNIFRSTKVQKLQDFCFDWAKDAFPNRTVEGIMNHLKEEADEVKCNPKDVYEYADVLTLLLDCAKTQGISADEIVNAGFEKIKVCKTREWLPPDENGIVRHKK